MKQYRLPNKSLLYTLHLQYRSEDTRDMHGDVIRKGGVLMGMFVRTTTSGTGKWKRAPMADVVEIQDT